MASKYYENWDIATPERSKKSTWSPNPGTPTLDQPKGPSFSLEAAAARALNRATSIVSYARFVAPTQNNHLSCLAMGADDLAAHGFAPRCVRSHFEACLHKARITAHARKIDVNRHMMANNNRCSLYFGVGFQLSLSPPFRSFEASLGFHDLSFVH